MKRTSEEVIKIYEESISNEGNIFSYLTLKESISLSNTIRYYNKLFGKICKLYKNNDQDILYNEYFTSFSSKETNKNDVKILHCVIRNCDDKVCGKMKDHSYYTSYHMKDYIKPLEIYYEVHIADSENIRESHNFYFNFDIHDKDQLVELINYDIHCKSTGVLPSEDDLIDIE